MTPKKSKKVQKQKGKTSKAAKPTRSSKTPSKITPKSAAKADVPSLFRLNIEVGDLDQALQFYGKLLGLEGRLRPGSRVYFTCGPVTLQVVDVSGSGPPHPAAKALSFTVADLDAAFERAQALQCLSKEDVHGASGGAITVRPWGERSFYVDDPWGNPLCFVEAGTVYAG